MAASRSVWRNEYFKTVVAVVLIVAVVLGVFLGLQFALHTPYPALTVVSGSMNIPYGGNDGNFWLTLSTPFDRTLSVGDIIIVQGVNPKDLNTHYPNSDIIVFHDPNDTNELIVHRIVSAETVDGTLYFITKGDGNGNPWPQKPETGFDPWDGNSPPGVPASLVVGKVVMRIPWFGWITIFIRDDPAGLPLILIIIIVIVILGFVVPVFREKKPQQENQNQTLLKRPISQTVFSTPFSVQANKTVNVCDRNSQTFLIRCRTPNVKKKTTPKSASPASIAQRRSSVSSGFTRKLPATPA